MSRTSIHPHSATTEQEMPNPNQRPRNKLQKRHGSRNVAPSLMSSIHNRRRRTPSQWLQERRLGSSPTFGSGRRLGVPSQGQEVNDQEVNDQEEREREQAKGLGGFEERYVTPRAGIGSELSGAASQPAPTAWRIVNQPPAPAEVSGCAVEYLIAHGVEPTADDSVLVTRQSPVRRGLPGPSVPGPSAIRASRSQRLEVDISAPWARATSLRKASSRLSLGAMESAPGEAEALHEISGPTSIAPCLPEIAAITAPESGSSVYRDHRYSQSVASSIARGEAIAQETEKHLPYAHPPPPSIPDDEWPLRPATYVPCSQVSGHGKGAHARESIQFEWFDAEGDTFGDAQRFEEEGTMQEQLGQSIRTSEHGVPSMRSSAEQSLRLARLPEGFDERTDLEAVLRRILRAPAR